MRIILLLATTMIAINIAAQNRNLQPEYSLKDKNIKGKIALIKETQYRVVNNDTVVFKTTDYYYDAKGMLTKTDDSQLSTTEYWYDTLGRITETKGFSNEKYTYVQNGPVTINRIKSNYRCQQEDCYYKYEYNPAKQLIAYHIFQDKGAPKEEHLYTYNAKGKVATIKTLYENIALEYNANGDVIKEISSSLKSDEITNTTTYEYRYDATKNWVSRIQFNQFAGSTKQACCVIKREF